MSLVMRFFGDASPRTPDRVRPAMPLGVPEDFCVREVAVGPPASPLHVHSCGTPSRQLPMKSPALLTGCSGATPARGIATPVRMSRRRDCVASQKEPSAPTPRALSLCDCGHCPACIAAGVNMINHIEQHVPTDFTSADIDQFPAVGATDGSDLDLFGPVSSPLQRSGPYTDPKFDKENMQARASNVNCSILTRLNKVISLSDLASPGPSCPCQSSPKFDDTECGFEDMELVQEIPICDSLLSFDQVLSECVHEPRKRQPQVWLPVPEIPTSTSCTEAASSDSMSKASDPRIPCQPLVSADASCRAHDPRKRRRCHLSLPTCAF